MRNLRAYDKEIAASLNRIMDWEDELLEEEMKHMAPHVFSEEFERKMEAVMRVRERRSRRYHAIRYAVAAIAVVLLLTGLLFLGSEDLRASDVSIGILEWMENFFVVENDTDTDKEENVGVLFDESQIGYLPEGFEKVSEDIIFSKVYYKYQNAEGDYVILQVCRDKASSGLDNSDIEHEIHLSSIGLEYQFILKRDVDAKGIIWVDKKGIYYILISTLAEEEMINIMNGISYLEER